MALEKGALVTPILPVDPGVTKAPPSQNLTEHTFCLQPKFYN